MSAPPAASPAAVWSRSPWLDALLRAGAMVVVSRGMLLLLMLATMGLQGQSSQGEVEVDAPLVKGTLHRVAFANDAGWYAGIVRDGYEARVFDTSRQANWAFFPLWPALWKLASMVTGELMWSGLALANLLLLGAMTTLHRVATRFSGGDARQGDAAVLFACFAPASYFFSLPQTESLFLLLVLASFLQTAAGRFRLAACCAALASATRFNGLFLLPALWLTPARDWLNLRRAWLLLVPLGTLLYMAWLWRITGNPLAFSDIQVAWGRAPSLPSKPITDYLEQPYRIVLPWNPLVLNVGSVLLGIAAIAWSCLRRHWGMATLVALTIVAPLATGTLMSMTRYLLIAFPIYLMLADFAVRRPVAGGLLLGVSATSMGALVVGFQLGATVSGA